MKIYQICVFLIIETIFIFCQNKAPTTHLPIIAELIPSLKTGKELSEIYCGNCHQYPTPDLLDKISWAQKLLPNMGFRLGIKTPQYNPYDGLGFEDQMMIEAEGIYPQQPLLAQEDWEKIVAFYKEKSPEKLLPNTFPPVEELTSFTVKKSLLNHIAPLLTMAQINEKKGQIYLGTLDGHLFILNSDLTTMDSVKVNSPPTAIFKVNDSILDFLCIGQIRPNEQQSGGLFSINVSHLHKTIDKEFENLLRPVQFTEFNVRGDNQNEVIVCEYGYQKGRLAWYEKVNNQWNGYALSNLSGSSKVLTNDFDKDGLLDLAVLTAQGDEHISIFFNKGQGHFEEKQVLRFPPVYGSCDIQLVDFDQNGTMDILCTNGDNADFSPVLKPYHGIRLYLNDGNDNFTQAWFYPYYGAFQAIACDFDLDGDMDIAATSFFPDKAKRPASNFIYLEQIHPLIFKTSTIKEAVWGKWMNLSVGDVDNDGDKDILLGSFMLDMTNNQRVEKKDKSVPFLLLQNDKLK